MFDATPFLRQTVLLCGFLSLAGCDNSNAGQDQIIGDPTPEQLAALEAATQLGSSAAEVAPNGSFSVAQIPVFTGSFQDASGNGYAYEVGKSATGFSAVAGLLPGTAVGDLPITGMAAMSGVYQIAEIGKSNTDGREFGEAVTSSGRITLRADFSYATLQGSDGALTVDGTFSGSDLAGAVYFNNRAGSLSGRIGGDRAVGAFHGADDATAMAGGFLVER